MNEEHFIKITQSLMDFCRQRLGYEKDPDVRYLRDKENANALLGQTANYNPSSRTVSVYVLNRHPKDVLRSLAHELVHHAQCCRGDLENQATPAGYAQSDPHMRNMEKEAYLKGNMMFRDWEDSQKQNNKVTIKLIGENKMTDLTQRIKERVLEILKEKKNKGAYDDGDGKDEKCDYVPCGDEEDKPKKKAKKGEVPPQFRKKGKKDKDEEKVEEGGAAQRHDNLDRLSRQDPDRIREEEELEEETIDEGKCPHCEGDRPKSECTCKHESKSELTTIKKNQASISSLNENRLLNLNKRLMQRLIK